MLPRILVSLGSNEARHPRTLPLVFLFSALVLSGCGGKKLKGVEEYRHITSEAKHNVEKALKMLDRLDEHADNCTPGIVKDFSSELQNLEVRSFQIRARAQAIQARGDAYFAAWSENMAKIQDARVRELAERFRPQLQYTFNSIKQSSQEAGAAFKPFLSGFKQLRAGAETASGQALPNPMKELIRTTRANGEQVLQKLHAVDSGLNDVKQMLTPK
jgi:hypothetical protein